MVRKPLFRRGLNLRYLVVGSLIILLVAYSVSDPLVSGNLGGNRVMKQPSDLLTPHLQNINELIKPYGEGRLLLLPLDYSIWSAYKLDNNSAGYQYLGPNEYMVIGVPTLTHYEAGLNEFLRLLYSEQNPTGIRALFKLGNINTIVFDAQKIDPTGNFPAASQAAWLGKLKLALGDDLEQIPSDWPFIAYHSKMASSYLYAAEERTGVNESTDLVNSITTGGLVLSGKSPGVGDVVGNIGNISIPFHADSTNLSATVVFNFIVPVPVRDIPDMLASIKVPDDWNVSGIVIDLLSLEGSGYSWVVPKPYPFQNLTMGADNAFLLGNDADIKAIYQFRLTINTISNQTKDFNFEISQMDIIPSTRMVLTPLSYVCIDSDHWLVHLTNDSTRLIIFSQAYDAHWTALSDNSTSAKPYGLYSINIFKGEFHGDMRIEIVHPSKIPSYMDGMAIFLTILAIMLSADIIWWVWRRR